MRLAMRTSTAASFVDSPVTLPTGWHTMAAVIDGTRKTMQLNLDGEAVATMGKGLPRRVSWTRQRRRHRTHETTDDFHGL
jgi:hypothetical protein